MDRTPLSPDVEGLEYESLAALGGDCFVSDIKAIAKANDLCNLHGLDTISTGATVAFAMECFENGIITKEDTEGIDLRFGNAEALVMLVDKIARREGVGRILGEGTRRAAHCTKRSRKICYPCERIGGRYA